MSNYVGTSSALATAVIVKGGGRRRAQIRKATGFAALLILFVLMVYGLGYNQEARLRAACAKQCDAKYHHRVAVCECTFGGHRVFGSVRDLE